MEGIVRATGQVNFNADQTVKISPRLPGRIESVFVKVGDPVAAGQTLAILDSVDAANALANARQTENKLRMAIGSSISPSTSASWFCARPPSSLPGVS